jgi:hypothetical protein
MGIITIDFIYRASIVQKRNIAQPYFSKNTNLLRANMLYFCSLEPKYYIKGLSNITGLSTCVILIIEMYLTLASDTKVWPANFLRNILTFSLGSFFKRN